MGRQNLIILGVAVILGLVAVILANAFFSGMEDRQAEIIRQTRLSRIAVAAQPIEFGAKLTNTNVRMADWPSGAVPEGAFTRFEDAVSNRAALRPLVAGEPILLSRVSGKDGRAALASNLPADMFAVAVQVSDVAGVGGFVRPGDLVDVILTRRIPGPGAGGDDKMADVVLQAVPVLAIDQVADAAQTAPAIGKTATLQVDLEGAQKLALARELGTISLALRNALSGFAGGNRTILPRDLSRSRIYMGERSAPTPAAPALRVPLQRVVGAPGLGQPAAARPLGPTMTVYRKITPVEYEVRYGR